jgi:uncharacterized protein YkwD
MQPRPAGVAFLAAALTGCFPPFFVPGEPGDTRPPDRAGSSAPSSPTAAESSRAPVVLSDARLRGAILGEVNNARGAAGLTLLSEDTILAAAASEYAVELARTRRLSHESATPGRRTLGERLQTAGAAGWIAAGENLAAVHTSDQRLVRTIVQGWLDSPGHRRNLLDGTYTRAGTGVARAADGYWYITQVYVQPASRTRR